MDPVTEPPIDPSSEETTDHTPEPPIQPGSEGSSLAAESSRPGDIDTALTMPGIAQRPVTIRINEDGTVGGLSSGWSTPRTDGPRFRILRPHARGGLGEVYVAEDGEIRREVALKEIRTDRSSDEGSIGRFVREAEITGQLEHPGVVPIYGAGTYADGRPYYAMRFIHGQDLKDAIREFHAGGADFRSRAFRTLLGRFVDVCQAVGYAHSRGVLHRDLKPGNIMLGRYGETLVVDWGLAKTLNQTEQATSTGSVTSGDSHHTHAGNVLGTPAYMSPEQAAGKIDQLGPATDIYALGGILHAILSGSAPVDGSTLEEVLDRVRRSDLRPIPPSAPAGLGAISRKAMALRPEGRYAAASDLAADIERWLADEPVTAFRDPPLARAARWTRKNPATAAGAVSIALTVTLASLIGLAVITGYNRRLADARDQTEAKNRELAAANTSLEAANGEIQRVATQLRASNEEVTLRAAQLERTVQALTGVFHNLDPNAEERTKLPLRRILSDNLDSVSKMLAKETAVDPLMLARMNFWLARAYVNLGDALKSIALYEDAYVKRKARLGPDHDDTQRSRSALAAAYRAGGQSEKALPLFAETLARRRETLGPNHPETLHATSNMVAMYASVGRFDEALPLMIENLAAQRAKLGPDHPDVTTSTHNLAGVHQMLGQLDQAIPLFEEAYGKRRATRGPDHPDTLMSMSNLAGAYMARGDFEKAFELHRTAIRRQKARLGPDHPDTLIGMNGLADAHMTARQPALALPIYKEVLAKRRVRIGPDSSVTLDSVADVARAHAALGQFDQALPLDLEVLERRTKSLGPDEPATIRSMLSVALVRRALGQAAESLALLESARVALLKRTGAKRTGMAVTLETELAGEFEMMGRLDLAETILRHTLAETSKARGPEHSATTGAEVMLADNLNRQRRFAEAEPLIQHAVKTRDATAPDLWNTFNARSVLGETLLGLNRREEARQPLLTGYEGLLKRRDRIPAEHRERRLREAAERVSVWHEKGGDAAKATEWRAKHPAPAPGKLPAVAPAPPSGSAPRNPPAAAPKAPAGSSPPAPPKNPKSPSNR
jgi:serine/threonine protein kinase